MSNGDPKLTQQMKRVDELMREVEELMAEIMLPSDLTTPPTYEAISARVFDFFGGATHNALRAAGIRVKKYWPETVEKADPGPPVKMDPRLN